MNHTNQIRNIVAKSRNLQTEREQREAKLEAAPSLIRRPASDAAKARARELAWRTDVSK